MSLRLPQGVQVLGAIEPEFHEIISHDALTFLAELHRTFEIIRAGLLKKREKRQHDLDRGVMPDFLPQTEHVRKGAWRCAPPPADMKDRRVEITGPVDRKMIINALNSGAKVFMADFEDATSPTWKNMVSGQLNIRDTYRRTISYSSPDGKKYALKKEVATLMVRPRGWHLEEAHILVDGRPMSGSLFDFGLCFFHNAKQALAIGSGPYFYLPKMESHLEARLWNDVFVFSQSYIGVPTGTIRATCLIETILASFEMDEILYELRDHSVGLNCGRWDYIFSFIKKFRNNPNFVLPDRAAVTMTAQFMTSYVKLLIFTCHKRGVHAMGGMAAQIPIRNDDAANTKAMEKVRADKLREVQMGHDGTWVAHPGLIPIAMEQFNAHMKTPNQIDKQVEDPKITAKDLLTPPSAEKGITEEGLRSNMVVGIEYLDAWVRGNGCVPIMNLMEDAATAEISRSQVWQWIRHKAKLADGRVIDRPLVEGILKDEVGKLNKKGADKKRELAIKLFAELMLSERYQDFLTLPAYPHIVSVAPQAKL
eukprot:TRINITY_DN592_c0_g1_i2.p2 TRINITY_DN592_c0_g1~~TRINITY_DN592_c0_g1_i2.p2  ORF type:complete len:548 (-),score=132.72 TRINITY_DN592_c0_g1_i2:1897-3504(-)